MKTTIWNVTEQNERGNKTGMIIEPKDIQQVVIFSGCYFKIEIAGIGDIDKEIERLNEIIKQQNLEIELDEDEISDFLTPLYPSKKIKVSRLEDCPVCHDLICFGYNSYKTNDFFNLAMCESENQMSYWDGSNWKYVFKENETELEISDYGINIDEWINGNWTTGGVGLHQTIHKIEKIDNKEVENHYAVWHSSQWQGAVDEIEILISNSDLNQHLDLFNRIDYSEKIINL